MSSAPPCRTSACCRWTRSIPTASPISRWCWSTNAGRHGHDRHAAVFVVLSQTGLEVAEGARTVLPGAEIHGLAHRVTGADREFTATLDHLRALFQAGTPIIGLCASGILIRALGPVLREKTSRTAGPGAVAEDASAVVPLLGGHHGANALARRLAAALGIAPAVTTAGDQASASRWTNRRPVGPSPTRPTPSPSGPACWRARPSGWKAARPAGWMGCRCRSTPDANGDPGHATRGSRLASRLVYHPPVLALGVGCERGAARRGGDRTGARDARAHGLAEGPSPASPRSMSRPTSPRSMRSPRRLGVPARFFAAGETGSGSASPGQPVRHRVPRGRLPRRGRGRRAGRRRPAPADRRQAQVRPRHLRRRPLAPHASMPPPSAGAAAGSPSSASAPAATAGGPPEADAVADAKRPTSSATASTSICIGDLTPPASARHGFALGARRARAASALDLAAEGRDGGAGLLAATPASTPWRRWCSSCSTAENRADWARLDDRRHPRHFGIAGRGRARRRAVSATISAPSRCPTC